MKFKLVEKGNPSKPDAPKKWYANPVNAGNFTVKQLAKEISGRSSLTRGDIESVLSNFLDELPTYLKLGLSIKLGDFGTLRLGLASEGVDNKADFNKSKISGARVIFTPSPELKANLKEMELEEVK